MVEKILYGIKEGNKEWKEEILTVTSSDQRIREVKMQAMKDGYTRFRIALYVVFSVYG